MSKINQSNEIEIQKMEDLQAIFDEYLLLKDRTVVKTVAATIISNQFRGYPNWLFIVAPSSGGKSEIIQAFNTIKVNGNQLVFTISDMTTNAFASGQQRTGKETSLLHQIPPGGILSFKDFTSLLSKAKEARAEIFNQLREIYDGYYDKRTGTGEHIEWKGKIGAIAGATEVIYEYQAQFSAMGDRFIMYNFDQPDRKEVLDFIMDDERINSDKHAMQAHLQQASASYVEYIIKNMDEQEIHLSPELKEELKEIAEFCTRVRSGVVTDERRPNIISFAPTHEMPMRMINQLINLAQAFVVMRKTEPGYMEKKGEKYDTLTDDEMKIIKKIAFDSIPMKRRMALKALATYSQGATTKGLATLINYQTAVVNAWLAQLNALKICKRESKGGNQGDKWTLRKENIAIMVKFEHIKVLDEELIDESEDEDVMMDDARSELDKTDEMASFEPPVDEGDMNESFDNF